MLNRDSNPAKGLWNGIGGKLEKDESARECVLRETFEETGIELTEAGAEYKGTVSWEVDGVLTGKMYLFVADVPDDFEYMTPRKVEEGILDWKEIGWILSELNFGVGEAIPRFLPTVLDRRECYEHLCVLKNNRLADYQFAPLERSAYV
jgi:8-oxo-dGTP diphosphatase